MEKVEVHITTILYHIQALKSIALLLMTLPGTPFIYYGQEIGMTDLTIEEHPEGKAQKSGF